MIAAFGKQMFALKGLSGALKQFGGSCRDLSGAAQFGAARSSRVVKPAGGLGGTDPSARHTDGVMPDLSRWIRDSPQKSQELFGGSSPADQPAVAACD